MRHAAGGYMCAVRIHRVAGEVQSSSVRYSGAHQSLRPDSQARKNRNVYNMTRTELNTFRMKLEHKQAELANGNRKREAWLSRRALTNWTESSTRALAMTQ